MPFITKDRREIIDAGGMPDAIEQGDLCYFYYAKMVRAWAACPRWRTAHAIRLAMHTERPECPVSVLEGREYCYEPYLSTARQLAWEVFFQFYVLPYEIQKREENGDVH